MPCEEWVTEREGPLRGMVLGWITGYIVGNSTVAYNLDPDEESIYPPHLDTLLSWIDRYCERHPRDSLYTAARVLTFDLWTDR